MFNREYELGAQAIIQMFEKKTRIQKPENASADSLSSSGAAQHEFTFDHSYWSFEGPCRTEHLQIEEPHIVSQEEVYNDIGVDVINSAFEGTTRKQTCIQKKVKNGFKKEMK